MKWELHDDYDALSERASNIFLSAIRDEPRIVLGLPTGRTPIGMYERVVAQCGREYHCFRDVTTFNLDEYVGTPKDHPGSYAWFMQQHLFAHVDIDPRNVHIPDGTAPDLDRECAHYEEEIAAAGGLGLTFLGLGSNGHIAFNEPGTPFTARTRVVKLAESTRLANADLFADGVVPTHAVTMGIGTILESRRIILIASGARKRAGIAALRSGTVTESFPASALWNHPDVTVLLDRDASSA
ncbi:MAG TPA: glucosamine-6-phosphate deaminase [Thermoanaerobaculia bacterium]|nr:glucosamine-6-phosphate deaminase [Thermoanaerobaculia bacterium]